MQMGSPGVSLVTVKPSSNGILRGNDTTSGLNKNYAFFGKELLLASNYSHVGMWNPNGSGVILLIDRITANILALSDIQLRFLSNILASDDGVWSPINGVGANGVCHKCTEQNVALQGTLLGEIRQDITVIHIVDLTFPLVVLPNSGIAVVGTTVQKNVYGDFFGREI